MVVGRVRLVAHALVALDVAALVLAAVRRDDALHHGLELAVEQPREDPQDVNVRALSFERGHVAAGRRGEPHGRVVLAQVGPAPPPRARRARRLRRVRRLAHGREQRRGQAGQLAHALVGSVQLAQRRADGVEPRGAKVLERGEDAHVVHVSCEVFDGQEALDPSFDVVVFVGQRERGLEPRQRALVLLLVVQRSGTQGPVIVNPLHDPFGRLALRKQRCLGLCFLGGELALWRCVFSSLCVVCLCVVCLCVWVVVCCCCSSSSSPVLLPAGPRRAQGRGRRRPLRLALRLALRLLGLAGASAHLE